MDYGSRTPLLDLFRKGDVPTDVKLLAARGALAPCAHEQLGLLVLLAGDRDPDVAAAAAATLEQLPRSALEAFVGRSDVGDEVRDYFARRGVNPTLPHGSGEADARPLIDLGGEDDLAVLALELETVLEGTRPAADPARPSPLSVLPVIDRVKLAMRGSREQRQVLIRDANRLVAAAVLSSPKLTETEVETFARMANVGEEVLRLIGSNRNWTKRYAVVAALARNPRTPATISMPIVARLSERDLKGLSVDRNVPEGLRMAARKLLVTNQSRRQ